MIWKRADRGNGDKKSYNSLVKIVIGLALVILLGKIYMPDIFYDIYIDKIISNMNQISLQNIKANYLQGEIHNVKNFNINDNILPFKNFGTVRNTGGNCEGYSIFEMLVFEGKLNEHLEKGINITKNLGEYHLDDKNLKKIYKDKRAETEDQKVVNKIEKDYQKSIKRGLGLKTDKYNEKESIYTFNDDFGNNELDNIIESISYLQNQDDADKGLSIITLVPNYDELIYKQNKLKNATNILDPMLITDKINNNKLVVIAMLNTKFIGHDVLAYKYEKISDTSIKIYVADPTWPIIQDENTDTNEIVNSSYIFFTKSIDDSWSYIYEPIYSNDSVYNSFIPGSYLRIICT